MKKMTKEEKTAFIAKERAEMVEYEATHRTLEEENLMTRLTSRQRYAVLTEKEAKDLTAAQAKKSRKWS